MVLRKIRLKWRLRMNVVDILLDENNSDPIILKDENQNCFKFEQIAVIPYKEKIYCILSPVQMEGVQENEAMAFYVDFETQPPTLVAEEDVYIVDEVFKKYYEAFDTKNQNKEEG